MAANTEQEDCLFTINFNSLFDNTNQEDSAQLAASVLTIGSHYLNKSKLSRKRRSSTRSCWVSDFVGRRENYGAFNSIMAELEVSDAKRWQNYLRMDSHLYNSLLQSITHAITKKDTTWRKAVPPSERLAVTLRYLATGESYTSLHYQFRIGKSTIAEIIPEVCAAIFGCLKETYLKTPNTEAEWKRISFHFNERWNFPHCIGALDGKRIVLRKPHHAGSAYHNYKGCESIVLMALADATYKFLYVYVGANGRVSDGGVFKQTKLYAALESAGGQQLGVPCREALPGTCHEAPYVRVADDAFALSTYLMKPFPRRTLTEETHKIFNYRLSRARRVVENAFGILASVFRVFEKPIPLEPEKAESVTLAACVLHNYLRHHKAADTGEFDNEPWRAIDAGGLGEISCRRGGTNYSQAAANTREIFCNYFNGPGAVDWQHQMI